MRVATALLDHKMIECTTGQKIQIPLRGVQWTLHQKSIPTAFKKGDIIYIEKVADEWMVSQVPEASGALVALNPKNGAIVALVGGYDFRLSNFRWFLVS